MCFFVVAGFWKSVRKTSIRVSTNVREFGSSDSTDHSEYGQHTRGTSSIVNKLVQVGEKVIDTIGTKRGEYLKDEFGQAVSECYFYF